MDFWSALKNTVFKEEPQPKKDKKKGLLDFIENNSAKSDFLHWVVNNTEKSAFSEEDSWEEIKMEVKTNHDLSYSLLRDYAVTLKKDKATEEALQEIIKETEQAEKTARRLTFLGRFKKFSVAVGGIVLFLGLVKVIFALMLVFSGAESLSALSPGLRLGGAIFLGVGGIAECLGGIFLIEM